jgi:hypothetical protein
MQESITDNSVVHNHVSPRICQELKYAGFSPKAKYFWKVYEMDTVLDTHLFDIDEYYKEGNEVIDKLVPLKERLPAYTIKEIEKHLPDYCVCKFNGKYEICIDKNYGVEAVVANRLPDAFALMMMECIRKRVIDLEKIKA